MSRTNIFDLLKMNNSISSDVIRIDSLFASTVCFEQDYEYYHNSYNWTLKEYVDNYCFAGWKHRHRCLDVADYFKTIKYDEILEKAKNDSFEDYLTIVEIIYNFWHLAANHFDNDTNHHIKLWKRSNGTITAKELIEIMDESLSEHNQKAYYFPDEEKCIIAEDSPQVTAAAEATEPEIALDIVRYNHRQLTGELAKKKAILKTLGDYLEGRKREITDINSALYNTITGALNNLNIRHNNIAPENKSYYHEAVADMPQEELEQHYDDLYQLILLAILEIDNVVRKREMNALIQRVSAKKS